jgi:hypothetical protein
MSNSYQSSILLSNLEKGPNVELPLAFRFPRTCAGKKGALLCGVMEKPPADGDRIQNIENLNSQDPVTPKAARDSVKPFKSLGIPKGVYRFKTHEEADEWMARMLSRSQK